MPLFEYRCQRCAAEHELLVSSGDKTQKCPDCGGNMEKMPSLFGVKSGGHFTPSGGGGCPPGCTKGSCGTC